MRPQAEAGREVELGRRQGREQGGEEEEGEGEEEDLMASPSLTSLWLEQLSDCR